MPPRPHPLPDQDFQHQNSAHKLFWATFQSCCSLECTYLQQCNNFCMHTGTSITCLCSLQRQSPQHILIVSSVVQLRGSQSLPSSRSCRACKPLHSHLNKEIASYIDTGLLPSHFLATPGFTSGPFPGRLPVRKSSPFRLLVMSFLLVLRTS